MKKEYMRMTAIELMEKLKTKPVFTIQDTERIAYCNKDYTEQIINTIHSATTRRIKPVKFKNNEMKNPIAANCGTSYPLGNEPLIFIKRRFMVFCIYAQR